MSSGTSFICVSSEEGASGDLFGVWRLVPGARDRSFALGDLGDLPDVVPPQSGLLWRIDIPSDVSIAQASLDNAARNLQLASHRMNTALDRLVAYAGRESPGRSFSATQIIQGEAERELDALLREPYKGARQSYILDGITRDWAQIVEEFRSFVAAVARAVTNYAWMETRIDGHILAETSMGWDGNVRSIWQPEVRSNEVHLHCQALDLAIQSRDEVLRFFALATRGAAILASAASSPIGPLLALPAAYRFINQVLHGK